MEKLNRNPLIMGIALSSIYLITRWITGYILLVGPEAMITVGLYAGVGVALFGTLAFILYSPVARKIQERYVHFESLRMFLAGKMTLSGNRMMMPIIVIVSLSGLVLQALAGGIVIFAIFNIPLSLSTLLFVVICYMYSFIVGGERLRKFRPYNVGFLYFLLIVLLMYFFIINGIDTVFLGIRLYHPYLLVVNWLDLFVFLGAGLLTMAGQIITDPVTWRQILSTEEGKAGKTLLFTGLIWGTIPLAFSIMFVTVISTGGFSGIEDVLDRFFGQIQLTVLLVLFSVLLVLILLSTFNSVLLALVKFIKPGTVQGTVSKQFFLFIVSIALISFMMAKFWHEGLLVLFFEFGILYAAAIGPIARMIFQKEKGSLAIPLSILSGALIGYVSLIFLSVYSCIVISAVTSLLILQVVDLYNKVEKHKQF